MGAIDVWAQITTERMLKQPWMQTLLRWTGRSESALRITTRSPPAKTGSAPLCGAPRRRSRLRQRGHSWPRKGGRTWVRFDSDGKE